MMQLLCDIILTMQHYSSLRLQNYILENKPSCPQLHMHHNNLTGYLATLRATFCQISIRGANFKLRVLVLLNEHAQHSNLQSVIEMQTWVG